MRADFWTHRQGSTAEVLLGAEPEACVKARGLSQISDDSALESLVDGFD
ncbi:MAG: hypothetical protein R2880_19280 [Deinococcales bacterium]